MSVAASVSRAIREDARVVNLLPSQMQALRATERFVGVSGGLGCGKSRGIGYVVDMFARENCGLQHAIISKSSKQLNDFLLPEVEAALVDLGTPFTYRDRNKLIILLGGKETVFHLLVANNKAYANWADANLAGIIYDEFDTLDTDDALMAWSLGNDRVRVKCRRRQTYVFSSPEGRKAMHKIFIKDLESLPQDHPERKKYRLIEGCTFDNPHLDQDYVRDQVRTRDPRLAKAYLYGKLGVSLVGQVVYYRYKPEYDTGNWTRKTLADFPADAPLHIGYDFNKNINPAVVHVVDGRDMYAVKMYYGDRTFDDVVKKIKKDFPGRTMWHYPDATHFENVEMLKREFGERYVVYTPGNPRVKKRVTSFHMLIQEPKTGERHYFVNPVECKPLDEQLCAQEYNAKDEPDKDSGNDHGPDAGGYAAHHKFPYVQRIAPRIVPL